MIRCLTKGLCQITYSLPRIQLVTVLYPTARMKQAVSELYAHIIRFLIRAHDWYQESKSRHFIHSLTRPVELRYSDVIDEIESSTRAVDISATAGAQAEQRDVHLKLQEFNQRQKDSKVILLEIRQMMISKLSSFVPVQLLTAYSSSSVHQFKRTSQHEPATFRLTGLANCGLHLQRLQNGRHEKSSILRIHEKTTFKASHCSSTFLAYPKVSNLEIHSRIFAGHSQGKLCHSL